MYGVPVRASPIRAPRRHNEQHSAETFPTTSPLNLHIHLPDLPLPDQRPPYPHRCYHRHSRTTSHNQPPTRYSAVPAACCTCEREFTRNGIGGIGRFARPERGLPMSVSRSTRPRALELVCSHVARNVFVHLWLNCRRGVSVVGCRCVGESLAARYGCLRAHAHAHACTPRLASNRCAIYPNSCITVSIKLLIQS